LGRALANRGFGRLSEGAALYRSLAVWLDPTRRFDTRLRILIGHELVHQWIGGAMRIIKSDGTDAKWFSEGFAVYFARSALLRAGLITNEEYQADLRQDLRAQQDAFRIKRRRSYRLAASRSSRRLMKEYHLGALYATRLDAQLRRADKGSLDQLVIQLLALSRSTGRDLTEAQWRDAVVQALGSTAGWEFDRLVAESTAPIEITGE